MKKVLLPVMMLALVSFNFSDTKLTDAEREMAVKELKQTRDHLLSVVEELTDEQLNFKSSPESWSVGECVEHLAISESSFSEMLQGALQAPADPSRRTEVKITDTDLMAMIVSRDKKVKTSEAFEPSGKFGTNGETLEAFTSKRDEHIDYVQNTEDDLRNHYGQLPFGTIDGYQILLFMSGHTERHVRQMEEVMAHPDFPEAY
jgi:hypothetical protein